MFIYPLIAVSYAGAALACLLWGMAGYAPSPLLQTKIISVAKYAPALASSVNIGVFNLGNALGAVIGGALISSGLGYGLIAPVGGLLAALGVLSILVPTHGFAGADKKKNGKIPGEMNETVCR